MAASPSISPSSTFTSRMLAPASTWSRATPSASSKFPSRISRANLREPVMLVRSPTIRKFVSGRTISGSVPQYVEGKSWSGILRGATPSTALAIS